MLHQPAKSVEYFDQSLEVLIQDMFETMDKAPGVGLAAPQIGVGLQVFVYDWEDDEQTRHRGVAINPELELFGSEKFNPEEHLEGCLSAPGLRFPLQRSPMVRLTALDLQGNKYTEIAKGWLARIFQHEFDHLQGLLYLDRLEGEYKEQADKEVSEQDWPEDSSWMPGVDYDAP